MTIANTFTSTFLSPLRFINSKFAVLHWTTLGSSPLPGVGVARLTDKFCPPLPLPPARRVSGACGAGTRVPLESCGQKPHLALQGGRWGTPGQPLGGAAPWGGGAEPAAGGWRSHHHGASQQTRSRCQFLLPLGTGPAAPRAGTVPEQLSPQAAPNLW